MSRKLTAEEKRIRKRESEKRRIEKRLAELQEKGVTSKLTYNGKTYTPKQLARASKTTFENALYSYIDSISKGIYTADKYISVAWSDAVEKTDLRPFMAQCKKMTVEEIMEEVKALYKQGKSNRTGSDDLHGFFVVDIGRNKSVLSDGLRHANEKGYTKSLMANGSKMSYRLVNTADSQLENVAMSNQFTERGMSTLMYTIMNNVKNSDKAEFYETMAYYCKENLPELYKKLF